MAEQDFYYTIEKEATAEFKDRGSKFIGYAIPVSSVADFSEKLKELKKLHPKATHHCFAYRLGLDGNVFRVSDDGEPSGSAGRPRHSRRRFGRRTRKRGSVRSIVT